MSSPLFGILLEWLFLQPTNTEAGSLGSWDPLQLLGQVSGGPGLPCKAWRAGVKTDFETLPVRAKGSMCALKLELLLTNNTDVIIWGGGETCHDREDRRAL